MTLDEYEQSAECLRTMQQAAELMRQQVTETIAGLMVAFAAAAEASRPDVLAHLTEHSGHAARSFAKPTPSEPAVAWPSYIEID